MKNANAQRERVIKLAQKLIELDEGDDAGLSLRARQILERLRTPMSDVLAAVPGATATEKARNIGVSRQAYYSWLTGAYRPNRRQSKRLAQLTGFNADDIFWKD